MKELLKELKEELLNKEMTLLDVDNECEGIIGATESIYNGDYLYTVLEQGCFVYPCEDGEILIELEVLEDYEDRIENDSNYKFDIPVKVTNISIL